MRIVGAEAIRNGVEFEIYRPSGVLPVRADRIQVQQVLVNLAMNGIDAMRGSNLGKRKMEINTALASGSVEVTVADTGTGIPPDKLNKVFDTFYTTKGDGTGLGLWIARTIVQAFGGKIWAENRAGGGALFRFTLPLSPK
jgi:signal transduction histidine kinase